MIKTDYLQLNISKSDCDIHNFKGQYVGLNYLKWTNKDTILLASRIVEYADYEDPDAEPTPVNLSGILSLRLSADTALSSGATNLFNIDLYNQGDKPALEDLANGLLTHKIVLNTAALDTYLGANSSVTFIMQYSGQDAEGNPFTFPAEGIAVTLYEGVDQDDAPNDPEDPSTYLTSNEVLRLINGVADIAELTAKPEAELYNRQRIFVESEQEDYWYDQDAVGGTNPPDDQTGGTGFWKVVGSFEVQSNLEGVGVPGATNDETEGYQKKSKWYDNTASPIEAYECVDPTEDNAVWIKVSLTVDELAAVALSGSKSDVGLANVNNTSDVDKPVSTAQQAALDLKSNSDHTHSGAEIKAAYESEADTNAFTDSEKAKLAGVEAGATADQSGVEIKSLYEGEANTNAFTDSEKAKLALLDVRNGAPLQDLTELSALTEASLLDKEKRFIEDEQADYFYDAQAVSGDLAPDDQTGGTGFWKVIEATLTDTPASIKSKYESNADTNVFTDSEKAKLAGVEAGATADQSGAEIKAAYEGEANTNAFTDTEKTKLAGVEAGATVDQSGAEIKALYEGETNTNAFTDSEKTKLSTVESGATADQSGAEIKAAYESEADTNAFTDSEKAKLALLDTRNGPPVQDITELTALAEAGLSDKEKRFVEDEASDYYYDAQAGSGDEAPDDQTGGTGFWIRIQNDAVETPASIKSKYESNADTNVFTDSQVSKLAGVEAGATADQSGAEIKAAYEGEADTNAFTDTEKTKLSGIESGATADQSGAEIKAAYEGEADTNAFTDTEKTKLSGIETNATADQTGPEIKALYEAEANTNAFTDSEKAKLAAIDAAHYGTPVQDITALTALTEASLTDKERRYVEDETADYFYDATAVGGDEAPDDQTGGTGFWKKVNVGGETSAAIKTKYESNADTNAFTDSEKTKLAGVEAGATTDQSGAEIKAAYEGEADTNAFTDTEKTKLSGIESGATADQSDVEIKTAYENNADTNAFTDTEKTKLSGIESGATADQSDVEIKTAYENNANTNAFTDSEKAKLAAIDAAHYGTPVQDITALTALTEASLTDKERRYVEDETADYFYDATAVGGDEAPDDQTGGTGFWKKFNESDTPAGIKTKYESNADTNAFTDSEKTKLGTVESNATADQSDAEIETAYNNQVALVSQVVAEAGSSSIPVRWSPERVKQAIAALAGINDILSTEDISTDETVTTGDLGIGKLYIITDSATDTVDFTLPTVVGRAITDKIAFVNASGLEGELGRIIPDGSEKIDFVSGAKTFTTGMPYIILTPLASKNSWISK